MNKKLITEFMQADEKDGLYNPITDGTPYHFASGVIDNEYKLPINIEPNISKMEQQTAVIWLQQAMKSTLSHEQIMAVEGLYQQALAMEKELIAKAWDDGDYAYFYSKETGRCFDNGEQYYNETYNK